MKRYLKALNSYMNRFLKASANNIKKSTKTVHFSGLQEPVLVATHGL
jgi:hypothetical protein